MLMVLNISTSSLAQAVRSSELAYLQNVCTIETVEQYMERMKAARPRVKWTMSCYHTQPTGLTSGTDVTTWTGTKYFNFSLCEDISETPENLHEESMVKLRVLKELAFKDELTKKAFKKMERDFLNANKHRDTSYRLKTHIDIEGYEPRLIFDTKKKRPPWASPDWCRFFYFIGLMWPYRIFLNSRVQRATLRIVKRIQRAY